MRIVRYNQPVTRGVPALNRYAYTPWAGLENEIDRLFNTALSDFATPAATQFPIDLYEDKDNAYVRADLPGVNRDDIQVELVDGWLNVTAARKTKDESGESSYKLERSIRVSDTLQADKVAAAYENGVLTVTLPKREESKPRKISVAVN
ncbi:MAG: Hsp20/alpha crystallin family protein [Opitutaceae bacterium]|nr:Hsp20/alpha crystallin family protein [Opitutaceae bacterium]